MTDFSHLNQDGHVIMVDVTNKQSTTRHAVAMGSIYMNQHCFDAVAQHTIKKGDVIGAARLAGIMATKRTSELIPLCHPVAVTQASLEFDFYPDALEIRAQCSVSCNGATGVEMEALTGVTVALLTIYDMCKAVDHKMEIGDIYLEAKSGGRSGTFFNDRAHQRR